MEKNIKENFDEKEQIKSLIMQAQMSPHFFCNAMLSIKGLIMEDQKKACDAVDWLIDYTRANADYLACNENIPFTKELEITENYLKLEKLRFGDSFEYELIINEEDFLVPPLIVQPLVENSIKHGIRKRPDGKGKVRIETGQTDKEIFIEVKDNGIGFDVNAPLAPGKTHLGLKNTITRIEKQCNGRVVLHSKEGKGSTIIIYLPIGEKNENTLNR